MTALSIFYLILISPDPTAETVVQIKFVAYGVIAYIIVGVGIVGNVLSLVVLTRPNLKVIPDKGFMCNGSVGISASYVFGQSHILRLIQYCQ